MEKTQINTNFEQKMMRTCRRCGLVVKDSVSGAEGSWVRILTGPWRNVLGKDIYRTFPTGRPNVSYSD